MWNQWKFGERESWALVWNNEKGKQSGGCWKNGQDILSSEARNHTWGTSNQGLHAALACIIWCNIGKNKCLLKTHSLNKKINLVLINAIGNTVANFFMLCSTDKWWVQKNNYGKPGGDFHGQTWSVHQKTNGCGFIKRRSFRSKDQAN